MSNDANVKRKARYNEERQMRHEAAQEYEQPSVELVVKLINQKSTNQIANFTRYDEEWFEKYDINEKVNEWVKGASDYLVNINVLGNDQVHNSYVEIKYKTQTFRKTNGGGITYSGSVIPNYGCESYYLDVVPVWKNICDFINRNDIPAKSFWVAFVNEDISDVRLITAAKISAILQNGWKGQLIGKYGEGYGRIAYLIPEDATIRLADLTLKDVLHNTTLLRARP
ncbi:MULTISPECIES: hypothetical protein [Bacillus]|uniref:hypothetical protein n=1 Tax=Bacillus TaxID=1386 RepID=UPI00027BF739|nr:MULTISPECIES: hypothetical protein [Bacillus]EJV74705.1 hypothetical protein IGE_05502 [Bacillus cereus HuB1-1]